MREKKLRVLITTNLPSPYMIDYLSELGKKTELTVLFEVNRAKDRNDSWYGNGNSNFRSVFLNGIPFGNETGFSIKVLKYLSPKLFDRIVIANPTTPTGILALLYCRWFHIPFVIQSEGGFQGNGRGFKEKFKKYIMEKACIFLTGMGGDNDYFLRYGARKSQLKPYPFSSLSEKDLIEAKNSFFTQDKLSLKQKLGIEEEHVIISVGRFSYLKGYGKGYDILMRMAEKTSKNIGFYIVGDEPTQEFIDWKNHKKLENVHFVPFKTKNQLAEYYLASDVLAILSRGDTWGLVVNEAMSYGLPVVSSDKCIAGIELIENNVNGFVLSLEDEQNIYSTLSKLVCDNERCKKFGLASLNKIESYTIENMSKKIYEALEKMS